MPRRGGGRSRSPPPRPRSPPPPPARSSASGFGSPQAAKASSSASAPPPARAAPPPPPPAPRPSAGGGIAPSLGGMVVQGMALGTGSALAHTAVHALLGGRGAGGGEATPPCSEPGGLRAAAASLEAEGGPCKNASRSFTACMEDQGDDLEACRYWLESLKACARAEMGG